MKLNEHYDWVVFGDHPGALLSACLAARMGLSVLVLPMVQGARRVVLKDGHCVDPEPGLLLGIGSAVAADGAELEGLLSRCLQWVGAPKALFEAFHAAYGADKEQGAWLQSLGPECRVNLRNEPGPLGLESGLQREILREFHHQTSDRLGLVQVLEGFADGMLGEWAKFPGAPPERGRLMKKPRRLEPREVMGRQLQRMGRSMKKVPVHERLWLAPEHSSHKLQAGAGLRDLLRGLWFGILAHDAVKEDPKLPELLHGITLFKQGARFSGGMSAYRDFLIEQAERLGVQIPEKAECRRIFVKRGRFVGLQAVANGGRPVVIGASAGISGCSLEHLKDYLGDGKRGYGIGHGLGILRGLKSAPQARGWRFTIGVTVKAEAVPAGMGPHVVWSELGAPPLEVETAHPASYGLDEPDHRILFVRTVMPMSRESLGEEYQRRIAARMLRQLESFIPFIERHVVRVYPDYGKLEGNKELFGFASPRMIPENLRTVAGPGVGYESGIEGLYVASGESYPWLGSFGPTVAAVCAADGLARKIGLSSLFGAQETGSDQS